MFKGECSSLASALCHFILPSKSLVYAKLDLLLINPLYTDDHAL